MLGLAGLTVFVGCAIAEHLLEPSLNPARHQLSEYANTSSGALMIGGLLAWALSLAATALCVRWDWGSDLLTGLLALGALGLAITACFATETIAGKLPPGKSLSTAGSLHNLGSGLATLALFSGALVTVITGMGGRSFRLQAAALTSIALAATVVLLVMGPEVGGLRQRVVVAAGCAWQLALLNAFRPIAKDRRSPP